MKRYLTRAFLAALALVAALGGHPSAALAQAPTPLPLIGFLEPRVEPGTTVPRTLAALAELGWVEGRDFTAEARYGDAIPELLPGPAAELVALSPDVIVTCCAQPPLALAAATTTIPIVSRGMSEIVLEELVGNAARPQRNVTGVLGTPAGIAGKQLGLLSDALPGARKIGVLVWALGASRDLHEQALIESAASRGLELVWA